MTKPKQLMMKPALASLSAITLLTTACSGADKANAPAPSPASQTAAQAEDGPRTPQAPPPAPTQAVRQSYEIIRQIPHDPAAFTQGLFFHEGILFESTGRYGESQVRKLELDTGKLLASADLPDTVFGEGSTRLGDKMIVLTWRSGTGFVVALDTLETVDVFSYPGQGWGLTTSDSQLIQSNGSDQLLFLDLESQKIVRRLRVTLNGNPLRNLNELEWIDGEVWANVWQTDQIVRINPETGHVTGVIDLTGLFPDSERNVPLDDVLNGIAYDAATGRIFVTGKHWPSLFEIRIIDR